MPDALFIAACDRETILELVAEARRAPRWTRVEDGLPEDEAHVLVFRHVMPGDAGTENIPPVGYHYVEAAYYSAQEGFIADGEEDFGPAERVTHWSPLPEPPEVNPAPILCRAEPAPPVEGRVGFVAERTVNVEARAIGHETRAWFIADMLEEMLVKLCVPLKESQLDRRIYRLRISVEPEGKS